MFRRLFCSILLCSVAAGCGRACGDVDTDPASGDPAAASNAVDKKDPPHHPLVGHMEKSTNLPQATLHVHDQ